jgi:uncharacterized membrane protein YkvA (DUF1232 family)
MGPLERLRAAAEALKHETLALWYAMRDPRTPLAARLVAVLVVAYAVSPVDLIPDFIPVLGLIDDLLLLPLGIAICIRLIPPAVLADCRERARESAERPTSRAAAVVVVAIWIAAAAGIWMLVRGD